MGKPCNCRYECAKKITQDQRLECFTRFWKLGSPEKQWRFVAKYVIKVPKYRCLNRKTPNKRQYTLKYFLPVKSSNADATTINVCKTMFLKTLAVSESIIETTFKKYDGVSDFEEDQRGKHDHHKSVITDEMIKSECDHVNSFVPVESHFIRKDSTKLYLDGSLSLSRMYKLYNEWFDQNLYSAKATTERQYRDIVNKKFNLGFHIPKKGSSRGSIVTAVFDFQKVLTCPHGEISILYYKRKLSAFNFTVFNLGQKKAVCYIWDKTVAKRGANEVGSCLLDYIKEKCTEGTKEFRFWSDNCASQNRNRFVFFVSITHRFLEKGHTQNEGDSVHALIDRSSHSKMIYTPDEWRLLENFFNFKTHVNDKQWNKNFRNLKILWTNVKEVFVDKSEPNKLYFKYDLNEESYECLVLRNDTRNLSTIPVLECAYTSPLKLSKAKYNDLESMCKTGVINASNAVFFRSLP
ncbi:hypothetical protein ABMA28_003642 [Loxostege sticticalis]|uniref:Uncharacterized protein n=1 Tax=Loxostege sticticalis TaxID=481309 RepID=A0ABD0T110_LOXSC